MDLCLLLNILELNMGKIENEFGKIAGKKY